MSIHSRSVRSSDQCVPSRALRLPGTPRGLSERRKRFARTTASSIHPQLRQRVAVYGQFVSMFRLPMVSCTSSPRQRWQTICPPCAPSVAQMNHRARLLLLHFTLMLSLSRDRPDSPHGLLLRLGSAPRPAGSSDHRLRWRRLWRDSCRLRSARQADLL